MTSTFDYLRDRIKNDVWLGKEVLDIGEDIFKILRTPIEWIENLPPIKFLKQQTDKFLNPIRNILGKIAEFVDIIPSTGLLFLESVYGINRAFNSKRYKDLAGVSQNILSRATFSKAEKSLYLRGVEAHNETLNLPAMATGLAKIEEAVIQIEQMAQSAEGKMKALQDQAIAKLEEVKTQTVSALETATGKAREKAQRLLNRINRILQDIQNQLNQGKTVPRSGTAIVRAVPVPAIANPTVFHTLGIIQELASFLLQNFLLKPLAEISAALAPALVQTTTSIVCKFFGSVGANASRYLAASVLKANATALPAVVAPTGMFGGAWSFLVAYAPYIILAAIIIIAAIKLSEDKTTVGAYLHLFAVKGENEDPNFGYAHLYGADKEETRKYFVEFAERLCLESNRDYPELYGIAIDGKGNPTHAWDLANLNFSLGIEGKAEVQQLWERFSSFLAQFDF